MNKILLSTSIIIMILLTGCSSRPERIEGYKQSKQEIRSKEITDSLSSLYS